MPGGCSRESRGQRFPAECRRAVPRKKMLKGCRRVRQHDATPVLSLDIDPSNNLCPRTSLHVLSSSERLGLASRGKRSRVSMPIADLLEVSRTHALATEWQHRCVVFGTIMDRTKQRGEAYMYVVCVS